MTDSTNLIRIIQETQPDEIYNLGAMSHVKVSFDTPEYTANADGIGTLRILEAVRIDRKSTRLNSSHANISYAVFCLKQKRPSFMIHPTHDLISPVYPKH